MASFNKVILMGNLTRDPELRVTANGISICKFGLATSRSFTTQDGTPREETTYVDIDVFGRQAEVIAKYMTKGRPVLVEGRLRFDQWETSTGEKRSKLNVVLENFRFIGSRANEEDEGQVSSASSNYEKTSPPPRNPPSDSKQSLEETAEDDVPF